MTHPPRDLPSKSRGTEVVGVEGETVGAGDAFAGVGSAPGGEDDWEAQPKPNRSHADKADDGGMEQIRRSVMRRIIGTAIQF